MLRELVRIFRAAWREMLAARQDYKRRVTRPFKMAEPEPHRQKRQHVSWLTYKEVKHSLKLVGRARGYETVKKVADMHNIGRTTAYRIKAAASYGEFKGTAKKLTVTGDSRAQRIPVHNR